MKLKQLFIKFVLSSLMVSMVPAALADEGMWLLNDPQLKASEMRKLGLSCDPTMIYNKAADSASLKDAVVWFNGRCTGAIVSDQGLVLTNHHCGYQHIAKLSVGPAKILTTGWYAPNQAAELPAKDLWIGVLQEMKDITPLIESKMKGVAPDKYDSVLARTKRDIIKDLVSKDPQAAIYIKSLYAGNQYLLIKFAIFKDIRLVGAPPESIGRFGGNKDNWLWPRHTADFSIFRIYASPDNKPAAYSPENRPYRPKSHIKTSLEGYRENNFALVAGYPGLTKRYASAAQAKFEYDKVYPGIISMRRIALDVWKKEMDKGPEERLRFADRYAAISNYEQFYTYLRKGMDKFNILNRLKNNQKAFLLWAKKNSDVNYDQLFTQWDSLYDKYGAVILWRTYYQELLANSNLLQAALKFVSIADILKTEDYSLVDSMLARSDLEHKIPSFQADRLILPALMLDFWKNTLYEDLPKFIDFITDEYGDDPLEAFQNYISEAFEHSLFTSKERYDLFVNAPSVNQLALLEDDPFFMLISDLYHSYQQTILPVYDKYVSLQDGYQAEYILGLMQLKGKNAIYPDANLTPRFSYGQVKSYALKDGVAYAYFTNTDGLVEKNSTGHEAYALEPLELAKLKRANKSKYVDKDGQLHACFLTTNDVIGGNSGSPVLNSKLELLGLLFDGNPESITSVLQYQGKYARSIVVDIRFILWCINELGGAHGIAQEIETGSAD